jgi:outer membrane protein OmpA-like peptidoglycan-associated protein
MSTRIENRQASALVLAVAACGASLSAHATEKVAASKQENIGVVTGLTVGAAAAGPFGAILGAAAGAWLGDRYHQQAVTNTHLAVDLRHSRQSEGKLSSNIVDLQSHNEELAQLLEQRRELEAQFMFRTGEATLAADGLEQLKKLGTVVATMPDMKVQVSGYADARGPAELNNLLSQQRAETVAAVLESAGIERSRLVLESRGESAATSPEGDADGYALDRKVVVRVEQNRDEAVAQRN